MIICHSRKLIFVKTKKVGGTSFEIALSKYCDAGDVITPISNKDEKNIRRELGFQGPANYLPEQRENAGNAGADTPSSLLGNAIKFLDGVFTSDRQISDTSSQLNAGMTGTFSKHMTSQEIFENIGPDMFNGYTKISIHREPLDFLISFFYFDMRSKQFESSQDEFRPWLEQNYQKVSKNYQIAPLSGPYAMDQVIQYENLVDEIPKIDALPSDFLETFQSIGAKGEYRDKNSRNAPLFFKEHGCADFIPIVLELHQEHTKNALS